MHHLFLIELVIVGGFVLGFAAWDFWKTDQLIKRREAEEAATKQADPPAP